MVSINPWKCFVVGAIGTCIVVNVSFLILSLSKPSIPVDSHPYEAGLKYQENIESEGEILRRGWSVLLRSSPVGETIGSSDERRTLVFSIRDATGNIVGLNGVTLRAINPAHPDADTDLNFIKGDSNEWIGNGALPTGQWLLTWTFLVNEKRFLLREKRML